jgi:hypothetical protein
MNEFVSKTHGTGSKLTQHDWEFMAKYLPKREWPRPYPDKIAVEIILYMYEAEKGELDGQHSVR